MTSTLNVEARAVATYKVHFSEKDVKRFHSTCKFAIFFGRQVTISEYLSASFLFLLVWIAGLDGICVALISPYPKLEGFAKFLMTTNNVVSLVAFFTFIIRGIVRSSNVEQDCFSDKTIEIHEDGLSIEKDYQTTVYSWPEVTDVTFGKTEITVWINKNPVLIVPDYTFSSEIERDNFASLIEAARMGKLRSNTVVSKNEAWPPAPKLTV